VIRVSAGHSLPPERQPKKEKPMESLFTSFKLGSLKLQNRFVQAPIKTAYGNPDGTVTARQLAFYRQIAVEGPALLILEPAAVTADGREHPKQLTVHLPNSVEELHKITQVIHEAGGKACLHLNHAGGAAKSKASGTSPKAPSVMTCPASGEKAEALEIDDIARIVAGYSAAAQTAVAAGFDLIEIQAGHGYLLSQFQNPKINQRRDRYGEDRLLFASQVLTAVMEAVKIPVILRLSGHEMSPEGGLDPAASARLLALAEQLGVAAVHVGMGNACFSPPWYFHHGRLPEKPQLEALARIRRETSLPLIAAGRMGRREKVHQVLQQGLADLIALGRPLLADPDLVQKWRTIADNTVAYCGYCLQGCLNRMKSGQPLGCNLNPQLGLPDLSPTEKPLEVLVVGGGPAGLSAAKFLTQRGHQVSLVERNGRLGGQFALAWQAPGKQDMQAGLETLEREVHKIVKKLYLGQTVDSDWVRRLHPDLLIWATGAVQNIPEIEGLDRQNRLTSLEFFEGVKAVTGPRVLVIGAGRTGLEIAEKLGKQGFEVVATKRTDPIGAAMEGIALKLTLKQLGELPNVHLMPHTPVLRFGADAVTVVQDEVEKQLEPFQTVILASGMRSADGPNEVAEAKVPAVEIIGDALQVQDVFAAVRQGYELAWRY
jgi:2,4-dienoyl-CoA reductase-like NADH-dependent reductase (Old Yellow Enzyme family)/thioredoxin reductase